MQERPTVPARRLSPHATSIAVTAAAVLLGLLAYFVSPPQALPPRIMFLEHYYYYFDASAQRVAHKALLVALAVLGLAGPWLRGFLGRLLGSSAASLNVAATRIWKLPLWLMLPIVPAFLWSHRIVGRDQYLLGLVAGALVMLLCGGLARKKPVRIIAVLALGASLLALVVPPLLGGYSFGKLLRHALEHYYAVFGSAPVMTAGGTPMVNCVQMYGLVAQTAIAVYQKGAGYLNLGDFVRIIQVSLVLFAGLMLLIYRRIAPGRPAWVLFCLMVWLPLMVITGGDGLTPTNSGLRFFGFGLGVYAMLLAEGLGPVAQPLCFGAVGGLAILLNLETGICVSLGFVAYNVVAQGPRKIGAMLGRQLLTLLAMLPVFALYLGLYRLGLGRWPVLPPDPLAYIKLFAGGYGGIPWDFDPFSVAIVVYPCYLMARLTCAWLSGHRLNARMRFKAATCAHLLIWLAYYANRAWDYTLYTHAFLFTALVIDRLPDPLAVYRNWKGPLALLRTRVPGMVFVVVFLLAPAAMNYSLTATKGTVRFARERLAYTPEKDGVEMLSGVWARKEDAQLARAQVAYLNSIPPEKTVVFIELNQFVLQLMTGRFFPLPWQDLNGESYSGEGYERLAAPLVAYAPDLLLLSLDERRKDFNADVIRRMGAQYAIRGEESGWLVVEKGYRAAVNRDAPPPEAEAAGQAGQAGQVGQAGPAAQ